MRGRPAARQSGFTLIELMVSMLVLGIVIAFIFSVQMKLTVSFRTQERVSTLQQVVESASDMIAKDLRSAGALVSPAFRTAALGTPANDVFPVQVINNRDGFGADSIRVAYADSSVLTGVTAIAANNEIATVVDTGLFRVGDIVVMSNPRTVPAPVGPGQVLVFDACVVRVTAIGGNQLTFDGAVGPYNMASNPQCDPVNAATVDGQTVVALFVARAYRVDPLRLQSAVLQVSPSGELVADDWMDLGVGFPNLQFASRYSEPGDAADLDGDGNPARDWYSGDAQQTPDPTGTRPPLSMLKQLSFTVVMRTHAEVSGVGTAQSPMLSDAVAPNHNPVGDFDSIPLPGAAPPYLGNHVYRYSMDLVNLRNLWTIAP